jgi:hypothetical protein
MLCARISSSCTLAIACNLTRFLFLNLVFFFLLQDSVFSSRVPDACDKAKLSIHIMLCLWEPRPEAENLETFTTAVVQCEQNTETQQSPRGEDVVSTRIKMIMILNLYSALIYGMWIYSKAIYMCNDGLLLKAQFAAIFKWSSEPLKSLAVNSIY